MIPEDLHPSEFDIYYKRYIDKLPVDTELIDGFINGKSIVIHFFRQIPKEKQLHRYLPEKWSIQEVLQHLIDTERIFMYRCFRIARMDATPLAGFDQNIYIEPSGADQKTMDQLLHEYEINRNNSISLLSSLSDEHLSFIGNSNGGNMSARAAAFTIIGHDIWHMEIIKERYL